MLALLEVFYVLCLFLAVNETALTNTSMDTFLEKFNEDMTRYSLYYVYIGAAVFIASYIQVSIL